MSPEVLEGLITLSAMSTDSFVYCDLLHESLPVGILVCPGWRACSSKGALHLLLLCTIGLNILGPSFYITFFHGGFLRLPDYINFNSRSI